MYLDVSLFDFFKKFRKKYELKFKSKEKAYTFFIYHVWYLFKSYVVSDMDMRCNDDMMHVYKDSIFVKISRPGRLNIRKCSRVRLVLATIRTWTCSTDDPGSA